MLNKHITFYVDSSSMPHHHELILHMKFTSDSAIQTWCVTLVFVDVTSYSVDCNVNDSNRKG